MALRSQNWRGRLLLSSIAFSILLGISTFAQPNTASKVRVNVLVIEASKSHKTFDTRIVKEVKKTLKGYGFTGATVLDELKDKEVEARSTLSLQRRSQGLTLRVKVLAVDPKAQTVKLHLEIIGAKQKPFSTTTEHRKGGTIAVALKDRKTFLAVTPKIGK